MRLAILAFLVLSAASAASTGFEKLAADAAAARVAGRLDQAVDLYTKALHERPNWTEGLWYLGTILYEQDRYDRAGDAFRRYIALKANDGGATALLGLCEFQTQKYEAALAHIERGMALGLATSPAVLPVALYHRALLLNRAGRHEEAWPVLLELARAGSGGPKMIEAAGLIGLRRPVFPADVPPEDRDLVNSAGRALWLVARQDQDAAQREFESVVERYPDAKGLHFAYGSFLLITDPDRGIKELMKELEISPDHVRAMLALTFEYLKRGEPSSALPYATKAATIAANDFTARAALGRVLLDSGETDRAIKELEAAAKLAPDSLQVRYSLGAAYRKSGRQADADRERATFLKLKKIMDDAKQP
jgi:tetratricopeptide (TPR) repeat protein